MSKGISLDSKSIYTFATDVATFIPGAIGVSKISSLTQWLNLPTPQGAAFCSALNALSVGAASCFGATSPFMQAALRAAGFAAGAALAQPLGSLIGIPVTPYLAAQIAGINLITKVAVYGAYQLSQKTLNFFKPPAPKVPEVPPKPTPAKEAIPKQETLPPSTSEPTLEQPSAMSDTTKMVIGVSLLALTLLPGLGYLYAMSGASNPTPTPALPSNTRKMKDVDTSTPYAETPLFMPMADKASSGLESQAPTHQESNTSYAKEPLFVPMTDEVRSGLESHKELDFSLKARDVQLFTNNSFAEESFFVRTPDQMLAGNFSDSTKERLTLFPKKVSSDDPSSISLMPAISWEQISQFSQERLSDAQLFWKETAQPQLKKGWKYLWNPSVRAHYNRDIEDGWKSFGQPAFELANQTRTCVSKAFAEKASCFRDTTKEKYQNEEGVIDRFAAHYSQLYPYHFKTEFNAGNYTGAAQALWRGVKQWVQMGTPNPTFDRLAKMNKTVEEIACSAFRTDGARLGLKGIGSDHECYLTPKEKQKEGYAWHAFWIPHFAAAGVPVYFFTKKVAWPIIRFLGSTVGAVLSCYIRSPASTHPENWQVDDHRLSHKSHAPRAIGKLTSLRINDKDVQLNEARGNLNSILGKDQWLYALRVLAHMAAHDALLLRQEGQSWDDVSKFDAVVTENRGLYTFRVNATIAGQVEKVTHQFEDVAAIQAEAERVQLA